MDSKTSLERWTRTANLRLQALCEVGFRLRSLRSWIPNSLKSARQLQIEVRVLGATAMRRMNAEFLAHDYATDVLSFPTASFFRELGHLGELVVCREVCVRQAREQGHRPEVELEILLVHGLLHLLGLDHERSPEEAVQMAALEAQWLEAYRKRPGRSSRSSVGLIRRALEDANQKARARAPRKSSGKNGKKTAQKASRKAGQKGVKKK